MFRVDRDEDEGTTCVPIGTAGSFGAVLGLIKRDVGLHGDGHFGVYRIGVRGERIWGSITVERGKVFTIDPDISDANWPDAFDWSPPLPSPAPKQ
jgi:hypothetical protein